VIVFVIYFLIPQVLGIRFYSQHDPCQTRGPVLLFACLILQLSRCELVPLFPLSFVSFFELLLSLMFLVFVDLGFLEWINIGPYEKYFNDNFFSTN
jgi:hypothetical protein